MTSKIANIIRAIMDLLENDGLLQFLLLNILNETFENADRWEPIRGSWSITDNKEYYGGSSPAYSIVKNWKIKNFHASFKVKATGTGNCVYGLVFRWLDSGNRYLFGIHPGSDKIILQKKVNDSGSTIAEYETTIDLNTWYTLECEVIRNSIKCYFNDELVIDATDSSLPNAGCIGLGLNDAYASAYFDDLQVSPIQLRGDEYNEMPIYHGYIEHKARLPCITIMDVTDQAEVSAFNNGYDGEKRYQWQHAVIQIDCWSKNSPEERDDLADAVLKCLLKNNVSGVLYLQEPLILTLDEVAWKPRLWRKAIRFKVMYVLEVE